MEILNQLYEANIFDKIVIVVGTLFWLMICFMFLSLCCYIIKALTLSILAKRANAKNTWIAFIPLIQNAKTFNLAGFTDLTFYVIAAVFFLAYCIPIKTLAIFIGVVQIVLIMYVRVRIAKSFGGGIVEQILTCLFEPFMLIYFALAKKTYIPIPIHAKVDDVLKHMKLTEYVLDERLKEKPRKSKPIDVEITEEK